jgi:nucleoside-diphosphate-sugar epimerase
MLKVLMIGGTGIISSDISALASQKDEIEFYLLNRGKTPQLFPGKVNVIQADINNADDVREKIKGIKFDVVADFISYDVNALNQKLDLFRECCDQYIFISSVAAYRPVVTCKLITEENTPIGNPQWSYGFNKALCEMRLAEDCAESGMNYTIVRPAYTYNNIRILHPYTINHWESWTVADRLLKGKPYVLHDDGQQLRTAMSASDFARAFIGLWGNSAAMNEDFHITSSEYLTWKRGAEFTAEALGVTPNFCFVSAEKICFELDKGAGEKIMATTGHAIFDNSKIRKAVPGFDCEIYFKEGARQTIQFYLDNPEYQKVSEKWDQDFDRIVKKYGN